jgi:hypothetical protein
MSSCNAGGTGSSECVFFWKKGDTRIKVIADGDQDQRVNRIECLLGCSSSNTQQTGAAAPTAPVVAAVSDNPLCAILNAGRSDLATLAQQANTESNPLKKDTAQRAYAQRTEELAQALADFVTANQMENYVGTVGALDFQNYNSGPGLILGINLPCKASISFQFVTTNPQWGSPGSDNVALEPWRATLENLAVNDTVTFSGRFFLRYGASGIPRNSLAENFSIEGIITDLRKN